MRKILLVCALLCSSLLAQARENPKATEWLKRRDLSFQENKGQILDTRGNTRPDIFFTTEVNGAKVYFRSDAVSYVFAKVEKDLRTQEPAITGLHRMDLEFVGANRNVKVNAELPTGGLSHFYNAANPAGVTNVSSYRKITYTNIYDNIDLVFYPATNNGSNGLKYDFIVRPGGNVSDIQLRYVAADQSKLNADGSISATTPLGSIGEDAPYSYLNGTNQVVASQFLLRNGTVGFRVGNYDKSQTLVIDPFTTVASTYYGSIELDQAFGVAVGSNGNTTITGYTQSPAFPVSAGPHQGTFAGSNDAFVVQFNPQGQRVWATYYGGSSIDQANAIAVDASNNVIIAGVTASSGGIATQNTAQPGIGGGSDAFVAKFGPNGIRQWGTYYGGQAVDRANGVAVGPAGDVYVTGFTYSDDFAATTGQVTKSTERDAFVLKLNGANGSRSWATLLGGVGTDIGNAITVSGANAVVAGQTSSASGIATMGNFAGGTSDAFAAAFNTTTGMRMWGTYWGGTGNDIAYAITAATTGDIYVGGSTTSSGLATAGVHQTTLGGQEDGFVGRLNNMGMAQAATYFGGNDLDRVLGIALGQTGGVFITGLTFSSNFPTTPNSFTNNSAAGSLQGGSDAYVARLTNSLTLQSSGYYGGRSSDIGRAIATGSNNLVAFAGQTISRTDFPTTPGADQTMNGGNDDAFVVWATSNEGGTNPCANFSVSANLSGTNGIQANASGGTGPYTYTLSNGQSNQTGSFFGLSDGAYTVTVSDASNPPCSGSSGTVFISTTNPCAGFNVSATSSDATSGNNGSITVNISGGTAPYTYTVGTTTRPGITSLSQVFGSLAAGSYNVIVSDNSNPACTANRTVIVNQGGTFPYLIREVNNDPNALIVCEDGSVTLVVANPQGSQFQWTRNGQVVAGANSDRLVINSPVFGADRAQIVSVYSVTGSLGQSNSLTVVFNPNPIVTYSSGQSGVICSGAGTGEICAQPQANVNYTWYGPNNDIRGPFTSNCFNAPGAGTWYALLNNTITGCKDITVPVNFTVVSGPARPTVTAAGSANICAGQSVNLVTAGQAGVNYQWFFNNEAIAGANGTSIFAQMTGFYSVSATSATTGCIVTSAPFAVTVNETPTFTFNAGGNTAFCNPADVLVLFTVAPAIPNTTYAWRRNGITVETNGSNVFIAREAGLWDVIVRNLAGCSSVSAPIPVTVNSLPVPMVTTTDRLSYCLGENINVLLTSSAAPGLTYAWNRDGLSLPNPNNSPSIVVNQPGNYRVTVTDLSGQCSSTSTAVIITQNPIPDNSFRITDRGPGLPGQDFACEGGFIGLESAVIGSAYQWYSDGMMIEGATMRMYRERRVGVHNISLQVTTLGCTSPVSASRMLTINPKPKARIITPNGSTSICIGQSLMMDACETGVPDPQNLIYRWILNGINIPGANSCTFSANVPGIYQVYIQNQRTGCDSLASVELRVVAPPVPTISNPSGRPTTFCDGDSVVLAANPMGDMYRWFRDGAPIDNSNMRMYAAMMTGSYRVEITVGACVVLSQPINVNVTPLPSAAITVDGDNVFCSGSTPTTLRAQTGADSYQWWMSTTLNGPLSPIAGATMETYAVSMRGFYAVQVMKDGCMSVSSDRVEITVNGSPGARIEHGGLGNSIVRCTGATDVMLTAQPPGAMLSYTWLVGLTPATAMPIMGADEATIRISDYMIPGGDGSRFGQIPGSFRIWVQIMNPRCSTLSTPVDIRYNPIPSVMISNVPDSIICQDGSVILVAVGSGANPGSAYTFNWMLDGEFIGATGDTLYARESGNYQVMVTADLCTGGPSNPENVKVQPNPNVEVSISGLEFPCDGVTLNAMMDSQYKYKWLLNGMRIPGATMSSYTTMEPGNYNVVIVNDITGCEELSEAIMVFPNPVADAGPTTVTCEDVTVTLQGSASGGDDQQYFYNWSGPAGLDFMISNQFDATPDLTVSEAGMYVFNLTVTDARGCISDPVGSVTVMINDNPIADAGPDAAICQNTSISLSGFATGGTGNPYTFFWVDENSNIFNGQTTQPITLNQPGMFMYTLVAIDANGCEGRDTMMVTVKAEPRIVAVDGNPFPNSTATFCFGGNLVLQSTVMGSTYNWFRNGEFVQGGVDNRYTAFIGGDFSVQVVDTDLGISCTSQVPFVVTVNPLPVAVVTVMQGRTIICPNNPVMLQAAMLPGYSFQWLVGATPESAVPASGDNMMAMYTATTPGTYWVLVTSAPGCTALSMPVNVTRSSLVQNNFTVVQPSGCGNNDGSIFVTYFSTEFPVEYSLNGGAFSPNGFFGNLSAGNYNVGIREVGGCDIAEMRMLTVAGPMNVRVLANSITDNSATVAWDFVSGGGRIRYNLRYRVVGAETWMMENNINGTSQVLVGLQQDTEYEVEVQTVCLDFNGIMSPWNRATFMTAETQGVTCETPSDIYVNIMTAPNMTPTVYWDNVSGAACYDLQYRTVTPLGSWITLQVLDANNPFPLVGLLPNTTYEVRMRAFCTFCNSTNFSAFSPMIPFTTPGACDPNFTVSINEGVNELVNCGDYTLRYEGQVRANYAFQWFVDGVEIGGATMPEFEVQLSGEYDLRLTVGNCDETFSNRVRLTIFPRPEVIANVQQNVSCIQGADGVIVAGCVDVPNRPCNLNPFGYSYMISNGSFMSGFQQSGIFTGLAPGMYTVTIRDLETGCENTYSDPQYTTVIAPDMAKFIGLNGASVSTALVEWNSVQGANAYLLSYRPVGSGEQNWTDELFSGGCPFPGSCNYSIEGLQNNTEYEVRIRTRCALGNVLSNWSDTLAFRTLSLPGCGTQSTFDAVPGGIFVVVLDQNTTQVFWNPVVGATCYDVRYRQLGQGDDAWVSIPTTAGSTTTLSNLLANTVYEYEVRSICGTNCSGTPSAWSAGRTFRTLFFKGEEVATTTASDFRVYPNPNNGTFTVSFTAASVGTATVQMYDMTGRQILSQTQEATLGNNAIAVTVNGYAAGIYMLHLNQGGQKQVVKVVLN